MPLSFKQLQSDFLQYAKRGVSPPEESEAEILINSLSIFLRVKLVQATECPSEPCLDPDERAFVDQCRNTALDCIISPLIFGNPGTWMGKKLELSGKLKNLIDRCDENATVPSPRLIKDPPDLSQASA